ncbi:MAG: cytochrome C [Acidobacteria bacterium]|nr:MAG: cytochrome C [Acidobacteriota bacterium]PYV27123.1 MAG: cytochrome C [Acidobacteriota bacterium]
MRSSAAVFSRLLLVAPCALLLASGLRAADEPDAAAIFKQKCSMCHGADGKGFAAIKTPDFTDPKWQESITDEKIVETIKNGKKGTPMPPFADKLKEDEIQALVKYIRSLNSEKKKE